MQAFGTQKKQILIEPVFAQWIQALKKQTDLTYLSQPSAAYSASQSYGYLVG
jgi:hypothetical protein